MGEPYYNTTADHAYVPSRKKKPKRATKKPSRKKVRRGTNRR